MNNNDKPFSSSFRPERITFPALDQDGKVQVERFMVVSTAFAGTIGGLFQQWNGMAVASPIFALNAITTTISRAQTRAGNGCDDLGIFVRRRLVIVYGGQ